MRRQSPLTRLLAWWSAWGVILAACASATPAAPTAAPATATPAPTPTDAPEIAGNYDGLYRGTTSQGRPFELRLENGGVRSVLVDFEIPGCEARPYSPLSAYYGQTRGSIEDGRLVLRDDPGLVITGTFTSATEMTGTLEIKTFLCEGSATVAWTASTNFVAVVPTPSAELLQLLPDLGIPDGLFYPEAGSSKIDPMDGVLASQGDWVLVRNFQSVFPVPAGWTTIETGQDTVILFSPDNDLDNPAVLIRLGGVGYIGDNRTSAEVMAEFEKGLREIPSAFLLEKKIVDESRGYYFLTLTTQAGSPQRLMVLFSEDVQGFFHRFLLFAAPEDWEAYYPLAHAMADRWADLELKPLGMPLPDRVSTENAQALYAPPAYPPGTWEIMPGAEVGVTDFRLSALAVDQQDQVWVGTSGGAGLYRLGANGQWTHYTPDNSDLDHDAVWNLVVDGQGRVWADTSVFDADGQWTNYATELDALTDYNVAALAVDQKAQVWIGNADGLFMRAPNGDWETYTAEKSGLVADRIEAIAVDAQGQIWAGGWAGMNQLNSAGTWTTYNPDSRWGQYEEVSAIAIDGRGRTWVGTSEGLRRLESGGQWTALILPEAVTTLLVGRQEQLWVGAETGLFSLDAAGQPTRYTPDNSGIAPGAVKALSLDSQGRVWIATTVVSVVDSNGKWASYLPEIPDDPGLFDDWVDNLIHDRQGRTWVGTPDGLHVLNTDGRWTTYTAENSELFSNSIECLAVDSQGRVWVGDFDGGVVSIAPDGVWETYSAEELELGDEFMYALAIDQEDRVWLGTSGDLKMFDPAEGWKSFQPDSLGFESVLVQNLAIDQQNQVWVRLWVVDNQEYVVGTFTP